MQNLPDMKCPQSTDNLYEYIPNFLLLNISFFLLVCSNLLEDIPVVRVLHDQAEGATGLINEASLETDHRRMIDGG